MRRRKFLEGAAAVLAGACGVRPGPLAGAPPPDAAPSEPAVADPTPTPAPPEPPPPAPTKRQPDVVFIILDDASAQRMACYGDAIAKTPNIDRLAASGLRFDAAHCNSPICNASRVSMLTGRRPETSGVLLNTDDWREVIPNVKSCVEYFRDQGYDTKAVGKLNHVTFPDTAGWGEQIPVGKGLPPMVKYGELKGPGARRHLKHPDGRPVLGLANMLYGPSGLTDEQHYDWRIAEQAVRVLSKERGEDDKPLLLAVGFHSPHVPMTAPNRYFEMFAGKEIPLPVNPPDDQDDIIHPGIQFDEAEFSEEQRKEALTAFYACQAFVDVQVGRILDALEASGRDRDTVVAFTSDHGFMLGEHFMWRKTVFYEECSLVPLIIRAPGVTGAGTTTSSLVELVDLFPTLHALGGLAPQPDIDGSSMVELLKQPTRAWKKAVIQQYGPKRRSIVNERWRYSDLGWPGRDELYDLQADPREFSNLAQLPEYAETVAQLRAALDAGWRGSMPE